jgi:hypothetical protein
MQTRRSAGSWMATCLVAVLAACAGVPPATLDQPLIALAPVQPLTAGVTRRLTVIDTRGQAQRISRAAGDSLFVADDLLQGSLADQLQSGIDQALRADLSGQTAVLERFDIVLSRHAATAGQPPDADSGLLGMQFGSDGLSGAALAVVAVGVLAMAAYERISATRHQVNTVTVSIELSLAGRSHRAAAAEDYAGARRDDLVRRAVADAIIRLVADIDAGR